MSYRVWIDPPAIAELKETPGHVRQRLKRAMLALGTDPRPADSKALEWPPERFEPRRLNFAIGALSTLWTTMFLGYGYWLCVGARPTTMATLAPSFGWWARSSC